MQQLSDTRKYVKMLRGLQVMALIYLQPNNTMKSMRVFEQVLHKFIMRLRFQN